MEQKASGSSPEWQEVQDTETKESAVCASLNQIKTVRRAGGDATCRNEHRHYLESEAPFHQTPAAEQGVTSAVMRLWAWLCFMGLEREELLTSILTYLWKSQAFVSTASLMLHLQEGIRTVSSRIV